jgi:hypothetical protein
VQAHISQLAYNHPEPTIVFLIASLATNIDALNHQLEAIILSHRAIAEAKE